MTEIEKIVSEKEIKHLVHFTKAENLPSIMEHGLLSVNESRARGLNVARNDSQRLDGRLAGISVSISFPNYKLFWTFRQKPENKGVAWVILFIRPDILWEKRALFCRENAASSGISDTDESQLATPNAFAKMFDDVEGSESREAEGLKPCDPTNVQAEVLVMETIEPNDIVGIMFNDDNAHTTFKEMFPTIKTHIAGKGRSYFSKRQFFRGK